MNAKQVRGNKRPDTDNVLDNPKVRRSSDRVTRTKPKGGIPDHIRRGTLSPQQKGKLKALAHRLLENR